MHGAPNYRHNPAKHSMAKGMQEKTKTEIRSLAGVTLETILYPIKTQSGKS